MDADTRTRLVGVCAGVGVMLFILLTAGGFPPSPGRALFALLTCGLACFFCYIVFVRGGGGGPET